MTDAATGADREARVGLDPPAARLLLLAAAVVALVVRVAFLADKPFWRDEAWVALLVDQPLAGFSDSSSPHSVPIGFVALVKLTAAIPGLIPEVTFRIVPLAVGLAVLPALVWLGVNLGASLTTITIAVWAAAGMPALVYYSRELKSYDIDLLVALLVPSLALRVCGRAAGYAGQPSVGVMGTALALTLAAAPWLSFGAVFPIVATLGWGWAVWWPSAPSPVRRAWAVATLVFICSFVIVYEFVLAEQSTSSSLHEYWRLSLFAKDGQSIFAQIPVAAYRYVAISTTYLFPDCYRAMEGLAVIGLAAWPGRLRWFLAWLGVGSAVMVIGLALADRYLIAHGRLLLFAAPPLLLFAAAGLERVSNLALGRAGTGVAIALAMLLAMVWSGAAIRHRLSPYRNDPWKYFVYDVLHDVDQLTAAAAEIVPAGEPLLVSQCASKPFIYYRRGRLPGATLTLAPWPTSMAILDTFLNGITRRGWVMLIDEESDKFARAAAAAGIVPRRAAEARGAQLWELTRAAPHAA